MYKIIRTGQARYYDYEVYHQKPYDNHYKVGTALIDHCGGLYVYVLSIGVATPYQNIGIGTLLLNHIIIDWGFEFPIMLEIGPTNRRSDLERFYERHGFVAHESLHNAATRIRLSKGV